MTVPLVERGDVKCRFGCDTPAEGVYHVPDGCACWPDPVQALCAQHLHKITTDGPVTAIVEFSPRLNWTRDPHAS